MEREEKKETELKKNLDITDKDGLKIAMIGRNLSANFLN